MAATLSVQTPGGPRTFPVAGTLAIGRAPDNDVVLEGIDVSRHHASLAAGPLGLVFIDLGSANGSTVNGREVEPRVPTPVRPGDTIMVADCRLEVTDGAASAAAATRPGTGAGMATVVAPAGLPGGRGPQATVFAAMNPRLEIVTTAGTREVKLEGNEITLGRDPGNQIVVNAEVVSRRHLVLRRSGTTYTAQDLGATNAVRIGGVPITTHVLRDGDVMDIAGQVAIRFLLLAAAPELVQDQELALDRRKVLTVGRAEGCDLRLAHPTVSLHHARISPEGNQRLIEDLGSTNGTFVNGVPLGRGERRALTPGDVIQVGSVRLHLGDRGIRRENLDIRLTAVRLNQRINDRLNLLQDISVVIEPQEFVAVVGVSGSGKSTLLGALSGLRPATDGNVLLNDTSLYEHFDAFRTTLGYVPQDDILHKDLPVARALAYAAELRLPDDTSEAERNERVNGVIKTLELEERKGTAVGALSGGQRKRVSIGAELLTQPGLFFLDEATSGLDPGTEGRLMQLLRRLADDGHTIVLITHATKNVMRCDQVLFLAKGGFLAYFGPPDQALKYFEVEDFDGIYDKIELEKSPQEWAAKYVGSAQYQEFVAGRLSGSVAFQPPGFAAPAVRASSPTASRTSSSMRQLRVLSMRYLDLVRRDKVTFGLLFLIAPVLSLIDLVAFPGNVLDLQRGVGNRSMTMFFLAALIPFLIGSLTSVREIVKETPIYSRERAVGLGVWPYLGSKIWILSLFAMYHGLVLVTVKALRFGGLDLTGFIEMYITIALAVISGVMSGLLISTLTRREEQAMMLSIGIIILQVVFSGGVVPMSDIGPAGPVLSGVNSTAWAFRGITAAAGVTTDGCVGEMTNCDIPGIPGLASAPERQLAFKGLDAQFGDVFNWSVFSCWAGMATILVVLGVALYFLQRRKDTL